MTDKVYITYDTAKEFLLDLIEHNDFSTDKEIMKALSGVVSKETSGKYVESLSKVVVDKSGRIYLPGYCVEEVKMPSLPKTVFLFFLLHPEGIYFKHLSDCRDELSRIYQIVTTDKNMDAIKMKRCIENLVEPINNRIYEACSIIRKRLSEVVHPEYLEHYCVVGKRGNKHSVRIHRSLVCVEHEGLKRIAFF